VRDAQSLLTPRCHACCQTHSTAGRRLMLWCCDAGVLACLDGYMNIAMEQTEEYVNGQLKAKYGDTFIRGNNGARTPAPLHAWAPLTKRDARSQCCTSARRRGASIIGPLARPAHVAHESEARTRRLGARFLWPACWPASGGVRMFSRPSPPRARPRGDRRRARAPHRRCRALASATQTHWCVSPMS
jgi:hypothetical protein